MATLSEALAIAAAHYQAGHLEPAVEICRRILGVEPQHGDALHLLGLIAHHRGQHVVAAGYLQRAVASCPGDAECHSNLGIVLQGLGRQDDALAAFRRAVQLKPESVEALRHLGIALLGQGRLEEAIAYCQRAVELGPQHSSAHNSLGSAFRSAGRLAEAIACYQQAIRLRPDFAEAHGNLGLALRDQGELPQAIACFERTLELRPDSVETYSNLGITLRSQGRLNAAIACYRRGLQLHPDRAEIHNNLGNALRDQGCLDEAIVCYQRALQLAPEYAEAHNNLGDAWFNQGKVDEAVACYQGALHLEPGNVDAFAGLAFALLYRPGVTLAKLADTHAEFGRRYARQVTRKWTPDAVAVDLPRRLRLGFVSADFGRHPVGYFLVSALENLDPRVCEIVCYSDRDIADDLTARFQAVASVWRETRGLSHEQLERQIQADRIDILFDLAGHTAGNRLPVFACKPAPLQVAWIGYAATTGLATIDYLLADRYHIPPSAEPFYCERVLRMPEGYVCFDPPAEAPPVGPLAAFAQGSVTFASFNNPAKIGPEVVAAWARVLRRIPASRLLLRYGGLDSQGASVRLHGLFSAYGVAAERVELGGAVPRAELFNLYNHADVALDPFPYSGGLTTCEALWMGVPVVTCPGETFASRHSLSHLSTVGLTETIARDLDEYVELAVALATDLPRLAALRAGLRERVAASSLCDGPRFAANLMSLLRDVWHRWCEEGKSQ